MRSPFPALGLAVSAACAPGCDEAPDTVAVALFAKGGPPVWTEFHLVPRTLELHHAELGWIEQPIAPPPDPGRLAGGLVEPMGQVHLPPGTYDQVRVGFVHVVDRRADPALPPDPSVVQDAVWILSTFCVTEGAKDARLRLDVFPAHPSPDVAAPTFTVAEAPPCADDTAEEP